MICWVCAGLTFWGAAAVLGICGALQAFHALHRTRHWLHHDRRIGQPVR
jgi:hypothetical protein